VSDLNAILITTAATLIGGMVLFIVSEFIRITIILPSQQLREQIQQALSRLDFHSNLLTNFFPAEPTEDQWATILEIKKDLRTAATEVKSKYAVISWKPVLSFIKFIPKQTNITVAYQGLIFLHNSILYSGKRDFVINEIEMNHNQMERVQAALQGLTIPPMTSPKEKS
jgi:hypothetical protein